MTKTINRVLEANQLKLGEKFIVTSLLGEEEVRFLGRGEQEIVAGFVWKDKGLEVVRICRYSSSAADNTINTGEYKNIEPGAEDYTEYYNLLK